MEIGEFHFNFKQRMNKFGSKNERILYGPYIGCTVELIILSS